MVTSIKAGFEKLAQNLEVTAIQSTILSIRQQNVRQAVERGFTVLNSFLIGSYARSTMIAPLAKSDIDIMMILDQSYFQKYTPSSLLDQLRATLRTTYPTSPKVSRNGQAVTITFTDFSVDIVPAFHRKGGGYLIPDSIQSAWISTNPEVHAQILTLHNKAHSGSLIPLIKMLKRWNFCLGNVFSNFYLELMAIDILTDVRIDDYSSGMRYLLDKGRETIKYKQKDPAGFGDQINPLIGSTTLVDAIKYFEKAYENALLAERYAGSNILSAIGSWRLIFKEFYPAYG